MTRRQKQVLIRIVVVVVLTLLCVLLQRSMGETAFPWSLLFLLPYGVAGYDVLFKAAHNIQNGEWFDENFLMSVATIGAFCLGESLEAVAVMVFYQIGEWFQSLAVGKSRESIAQLMDICPEVAYVEGPNGLEEVDPDDVEEGTVIVVRPGERVPIDGVVCEGTSRLNTADLTGESNLRSVQVGDEVISGCVNVEGLLKVKTTKAFEDSTVSKILELVENSSLKKARVETFITRFAKVYTPAVCAVALVLAIVPSLLTGDWRTWVFRALTFLVISCPCALVISIPLTFFGGIGGASRQGILVKGGTDLESLAEMRVAAFDKTGTLTQGRFAVTKVWTAEGVSQEEVVQLAAAVERYSTHPIARAICEASSVQREDAVTEVEELSGEGIHCFVEGCPVWVGNEKLMARAGAAVPTQEGSGTMVHVAKGTDWMGTLRLEDALKETSLKTIQELKKQGVRCVMFSGDLQSIAQDIGRRLEMDDVRAELLPQEKVYAMEQLLEQNKEKGTVAFVGDGINDAPVLMRSDVGIAMGALGSDAAVEAADVVLMDDDPLRLPLARRIARKCMRIVRQNIVFAIGVKLLFLALAAFGVANMWWAVFADVGVMILAVLNATRMLWQKT